MKTYSNEAIVAKLVEVYKNTDFSPMGFEVSQSPGHVRIKVKRMYDVPGLSFAMMMSLGEFFDTQMIETESEYYHGGCETCDYGSEAGYELHVSEGAPFTAQRAVKP